MANKASKIEQKITSPRLHFISIKFHVSKYFLYILYFALNDQVAKLGMLKIVIMIQMRTQ